MLLACIALGALVRGCIGSTSPSIVVVGSVNADIIIPVARMPQHGETVVARQTPESGNTVPGGKGANQAVACSRLGCRSFFGGRWGADANAAMLKGVLQDDAVDVKLCTQSDRPSGMGLVFLQEDGAGCCIVVGGSNADWPDPFDPTLLLPDDAKVACIMLQMEVPQRVNEAVAALASSRGIPVFQDVGGEDREVSREHLQHCLYISPNLSELRRLTKLPIADDEDVVTAAKYLQSLGARNVLVTLGTAGSLLVSDNGDVIRQPCISVDNVIDETGAGDNYRAAFVVAHFIDNKSAAESMEFAAASGALSVQKLGAIPSCSYRAEVDDALRKHRLLRLKGGASDDCPFKFASRLNSMKDRADLWPGGTDVTGLVRRQGRVKGLHLVDFNYPQHISAGPVTDEAKTHIVLALDDAGLRCGAVCLRYPKKFQLGSLTNPDSSLRREAIELTKQACEWAIALNSSEVVVWSAFDGYDYSLQVDYDAMWALVVSGFREICDAYPTVKVSLEYKPTDENTRFFAVPSTGAAVLLVNEVDRPNFGLTLDFGHCLMAGENPAQAVAMVRSCARGADKLFGVQLGDGYGRLGAEDGLAFGSVHSRSALEFVLWLIRTEYKGHIYFDTFPRNEDPVREAEYNIRTFKRMYKLARKLIERKDGALLRSLETHDAMSVLEMLEKEML